MVPAATALPRKVSLRNNKSQLEYLLKGSRNTGIEPRECYTLYTLRIMSAIDYP